MTVQRLSNHNENGHYITTVSHIWSHSQDGANMNKSHDMEEMLMQWKLQLKNSHDTQVTVLFTCCVP